MRLSPPVSSPAHRPPQLLLLVFVALVGLTAISGTRAAALPAVKERAGEGCAPVLSGLVQEIRKAGEPDVLWKAVGGEGAAQDGVKAVKISGRRTAPLPLELEWFVEHTDEPGVYSISSSATVSSCGQLASSASVNPFSPPPQRAFAPGDAAASATSCSPAHLFRLTCASCDTHEDSAHGCLVQSVTKGECVELLPPRKKGERPRLGWGVCATEEKGWKGREERDQRRQRQLWDIIPS
ncbi:hypothetical protein JCM10450v2_007609 [Rhodotorula kratochvilovae]